MTMTTNPSSPLSAPVGVEGLIRLLERIRDLLASLPVDCLGSGTSASGQPYPIRDEVIHGITKALAQQPAAVYQCPRCATSMEVDPTAKPVAVDGATLSDAAIVAGWEAKAKVLKADDTYEGQLRAWQLRDCANELRSRAALAAQSGGSDNGR